LAKNTGDGTRKGAVKERVQALNPVTKRYVKIDTNTGRIVDHKKTAGPYKGVREAKSTSKKK
jgi:glutamate dehydrogenase/leucine dehydrogenase